MISKKRFYNSKEYPRCLSDKSGNSNILVLAALIIMSVIVISCTQYNSDTGQEGSSVIDESVVKLCSQFKAIQSEVTCEEAVEIALAKYPGEAYGVEVTDISSPLGTKTVWVVSINLETPIKTPADETRNKVEVLINRDDGGINFIRMG